VTITNPTVDDLAGILLPAARAELKQQLDSIHPSDLTACEVVALLTLLRPVRERVSVVADTPDLRLVRSRKRGRRSPSS
jgi:hypothetical protein